MMGFENSKVLRSQTCKTLICEYRQKVQKQFQTQNKIFSSVTHFPVRCTVEGHVDLKVVHM